MDPILIVGPGALGGVLAARWALAGQSVCLLGRTRRAEEELVKKGLTYLNQKGLSKTIKKGITGARLAPPRSCQAAYFCVKSSDTASAIRAASPFIGPQTPIVSLQNGLDHVKPLRRAFGPSRTAIGTAYFAAERSSAHRFAHNGGSNVFLAEHDSNASAVKTARRHLSLAGWSVGIKRSEKRMLWTKLCFNAAVNGIGTLCAEPNGRLAQDPALRQLVEAVAREASSLCRKAGSPPLYRRMDDLVTRGCRNAPSQKNSTLQDMRKGRPTEASAIFGPFLQVSRKTGAPAPLITLISDTLKRLERLRPR